jgi:hypothetical protein
MSWPATGSRPWTSKASSTSEPKVGGPTLERVTRPTPAGSRRHVTGRRVLAGLGLIVAIYLVVRGIAEPFLIDADDPDSYRNDWGGPSLIGVLAVHSGPALVIVTVAIVWLVRRHRRDGSKANHP